MPLADPRHLTPAEIDALESRCARANMAIYSAPHLPAADKSTRQTARTSNSVWSTSKATTSPTRTGCRASRRPDDEGSVRGEYIPYTHKPINWHTDGYYNALDRRILGMTLHCAQDAEAGGENALLDHEIAYIQLRDVNPDYIAALMQPDAMTIPARMDEDNIARPEQSGPVFAVDPGQGFLYMRYTARTRSIVWKDDAITQAAVKTLADILAGSEYILTARLTARHGSHLQQRAAHPQRVFRFTRPPPSALSRALLRPSEISRRAPRSGSG